MIMSANNPNSDNIRFTQRLHNFRNVMARLEEALDITSPSMTERGSDIDLAIIGPNISHATRLRFHDYLNQQTLIPFFVDVLDYQTLTHAELRQHIDTHGVVIYEHE